MKHPLLALAFACGIGSALGCSDDSADAPGGRDGGVDARGVDAPGADALQASDGPAGDAAASDGGAGDVAGEAGPVAKAGTLDLGFGNSGVVKASLVDGTDAISAALALPDGKILVAGSGSGAAVFARFTATGQLDSSFSGDGVLVKPVSGATSTVIHGLALAADGDVIAAGYTDVLDGRDVVLMRLRADGTLDPAFGTMGVAHPDLGGNETAFDVAVRASDGKILVVGRSDELGGQLMLARYTPSGALDVSLFGTGVIAFPLGTNGIARRVALLSTGKVVIAGSSAGGIDVLQLDGDGAADATFGTGGHTRVDVTSLPDFATGLAIDASGRIVVTGQVGASDPPADTFVLRLTDRGALDSTFNLSGKTVLAVSADLDTPAAGVRVDSSGRIVLGGRGFWSGSAEMFALRLLDDGNRDTTFGAGGVARISAGNGIVAEAMVLDSFGRIVLAGFVDDGMFDAAVVRLSP